jgi:hypothetical protein
LPTLLKTEGEFAASRSWSPRVTPHAVGESDPTDAVAWRGKKFTDDELKAFANGKLVGKYCQIQIVTKTRTATCTPTSGGDTNPAGTTSAPATEPFSYSC